jgi:hypothetical protein
MNREEIIRMAREAGIRDCTCNGELGCLERFAALVAAAAYAKGLDDGAADFERIMVPALIAVEREACAKTAEDFLTRGRSPFGYRVAEAIRARNKE